MPKRRSKSVGSITKRKDKDLYQGQVTVGYDQNGKQKRKTVYGKTKREVETKMLDIRHRVETGTYADSGLTLKQFALRFLKEKERQVAPRTVESYRYSFERYIFPRLGRVKLTTLNAFMIQAALGDIADEVSPHTSNRCRSLLAQTLKQAVRWGFLAQNPVKGTDPVREVKREQTIWTPQQTAKFIAAAEGHRLYALFYLAITSGLRSGELLGLKWEDLGDAAVRVRRSLKKEGGKLVLSSPKTERSQRRVTLAEDTLAVLEEHRERQAAEIAHLGDAWERPEHMFTSETGTFLDHRNVLRVWHRIQAKAEVPRARLHDARHLHVSLLINHGLDPNTIADRVGHTDSTFTYKQYGHLFEAQRKAAAVPLAELLRFGEEDAGEDE